MQTTKMIMKTTMPINSSSSTLPLDATCIFNLSLLTFVHHSLFTKWYNNYKHSEMLCRWSRWTGAYEDGGGVGITECKWDILNPCIDVESRQKNNPRNLHAHMFMYVIRNYERQSVHGLNKCQIARQTLKFGVKDARWCWAFVSGKFAFREPPSR